MAFVAFHQGMRSYQRKAVLVILDCIQRDIPALDGVAAFTIRAELAAMDVCMAIGTTCTGVLEVEARVALGATHPLVHPAQRISRLVVVEFGNGADRLPTGARVAILARYSQRPVGIGHLGLRLAGCALLALGRRLL